jgi:hypothetical protein
MAYTTIDYPQQYFQCTLYTGNETNRTITLDDTDANTDPDFVWIKARNDANSHELFDSVRGVQKPLSSDSNASEGSTSDSLTAFNTDGFDLGAGGGINGTNDTLVAWCWKESATAGFDIVGYTGNASNRTISHSLSAVPKMMIIKRRTGTATAWLVYHASVGATKGLNLNTTAAPDTASTYFQDTAPSSSVFTLGATGEVNEDGATYINYLFAEKQGFSKFGSYVGNGSNSGSYIHLGFKPAWFMVKRTNASGDDWVILDNKRDIHNVGKTKLFANDSRVEESAAYIDFLSQGVKMRSAGGDNNTSGSTYIYMAFAESPFVNSNGVPNNAR